MLEAKKPGLYNEFFCNHRKKIAVLIDPDKHNEKSLQKLVESSTKSGIDFLMVGGSLLITPIHQTIEFIKQNTKIPLILFPGNLLQLSDKVDAIFLLSLISGRNSEFLIGNHVIAAPFIKQSGIETIPTGYLLIGSERKTSVEYMSNTMAIPFEKTAIAVATSIAGELLGQKLIYLDAGSGAENPVPVEMIKKVKSNISIPLIVGGGLKNAEQINKACSNGADIIVVGNSLEKDPDSIFEFADIVHRF